MTFTIAASAVSVCLFAAFIAVLCTDFGRRLRLHGVAKAYSVAFAFPILIFLVTFSLLSSVVPGSNIWFSSAVGYFVVYSGLNSYTIIKNLIDIIRVWEDVDKARTFGKT